MSHIWQCLGRRYEIGARPLVMGIVNVTPDSFSDGGRYDDHARAIDRGLQMMADGADLIDVGGESTRPRSQPVPLEEELRRVLPVVAGLAKRSAVVSIDTSKAEVARQAVDAGAAIVNDVTGLRGDPAMPGVVARSGAGAVVMHMLGTPQTMQDGPTYDDVVGEIRQFFARRLEELAAAGVSSERVCFDPGIGFGKTLEHNLTLLANLGEFQSLGRPVLLGVSRKKFIGDLCGREVADRGPGSLAAATAAAAQGFAQVLRVHDVAPCRDAAVLLEAIARRKR